MFLKVLLLLQCVGWGGGCTQVCGCPKRPDEGVRDPLELELQALSDCLMEMPGTDSGFSVGVASTLNCQAISPAAQTEKKIYHLGPS